MKFALFMTFMMLNMLFYSLLINYSSSLKTEIAYVMVENQNLKQAMGGLEQEVSNIELMFSSEGKKYPFPINSSDFMKLSSPYGIRISPINYTLKKHLGVDIYTDVPRSQVIAIADGVIVDSWPPPGKSKDGSKYYSGHPVYGGMVKVRHDDGSIALYGHLSAKYVSLNERVKAGQVIGREGSTGKSTAEHLHFELKIDNEYVNPLLWIATPSTGENND